MTITLAHIKARTSGYHIAKNGCKKHKDIIVVVA